MDDFAAQLEGELGIPKPVPILSAETGIAHPSTAAGSSRQAQVMSNDLRVDFGVKYIEFPPDSGRLRPILTQSKNGACSILALVNILSLRGELTLPCTPEKPNDRLDFATIASCLINHLLASDKNSGPELDSVLALLPDSSRGLDVNPGFSSPTTFKPANAPVGSGSELVLFKMCNVKLVHGWCVEQDNFLWNEDYESVMDRLAVGTELEDNAIAFPATPVSSEDKIKIQEAVMIKLFMETYATQITQHGLHLIRDLVVNPGELVAFLRNNHINSLFRCPRTDLLYVLVTDDSLRMEKQIVWESVVNIEGNGDFVDENFRKSSAVGGDVAGVNPNQLIGMSNQTESEYANQLDGDQALAISLQEEENARDIRSNGRVSRNNTQEAVLVPSKPKISISKRLKGKCVIM